MCIYVLYYDLYALMSKSTTAVKKYVLNNVETYQWMSFNCDFLDLGHKVSHVYCCFLWWGKVYDQLSLEITSFIIELPVAFPSPLAAENLFHAVFSEHSLLVLY